MHQTNLPLMPARTGASLPQTRPAAGSWHPRLSQLPAFASYITHTAIHLTSELIEGGGGSCNAGQQQAGLLFRRPRGRMERVDPIQPFLCSILAARPAAAAAVALAAIADAAAAAVLLLRLFHQSAPSRAV